MIYFLDANVLIDAHRDYYSLSRIPEFWDWLEYQGSVEKVKIPIEVHEEIKGKGELAQWARQESVKSRLLFSEEVDRQLVSDVVERGYAPDLTDDEVEKIGRDPFLVAYAMVDPSGRTVVSTEVSKPKKQRANRHLPDVCKTLRINCIDTFGLVQDLNFTTNWCR